MRNIPDVAMTATNIFMKANNGVTYMSTGTSAAAPLWAGFMALVNQQAAAAGQPPVGFINPAIYAIGRASRIRSDFHDITTGNNFNAGSPSKFSAVAGYDLCTGWGSPNGLNLILALATPDALAIQPGAGFGATGAFGRSVQPRLGKLCSDQLGRGVAELVPSEYSILAQRLRRGRNARRRLRNHPQPEPRRGDDNAGAGGLHRQCGLLQPDQRRHPIPARHACRFPGRTRRQRRL